MYRLGTREIELIRAGAEHLRSETVRGDLLVSEILAWLLEDHEDLFRDLCEQRRDPGEAVRMILPDDLM